MKIKSWNGKWLPSELDLVLTHLWLKYFVKSHPMQTMFQCAEKGARIKGFYHQKLTQLEKIFKETYDIEKMLYS